MWPMNGSGNCGPVWSRRAAGRMPAANSKHAIKLGPTKQTKTALTFFQQLFYIEAQYRTCSDDERLAARLEKSAPIVEAFHY